MECKDCNCASCALSNFFQQQDELIQPSLNAFARKLILEDPNKQKWIPFSFGFKPKLGHLCLNAAFLEKFKIVVWHDREMGLPQFNLEDLSNGFGRVDIGFL
uniref:Uncharacterized protein n=1 Tax=Manihot esculenta TaxID=3983 RepID=A0A2C9WNP0_MANES